tara:strand:+ start:1822 stop:2610 length:789 start_codon:yes stop_codon:yes gene_type:complete
MMSSLLGWILQQSDSYESTHCVIHEHALDEKKIGFYLDPWDNHSDDPDNWSHAFIEDVEDENLGDNFTWLNEFVDSFKCNTIFGLSYGEWRKTKSWENSNVNKIAIPTSDKIFNLFYEVYERRSVSPAQCLKNIQMHVHDHKQDEPVYNERMMNEIYPKALEYANRGELEFWQLQYCFHHNGADVPGPEERENIKNIIKQEIAIDTSNDYDLRWSIFIEDAIVIEDLFNIDLKGLCKQLNIVYNERIGIEYKKFLDYANDII